ncbi:hypothetical protein GJ744_006795 [Endocarpon pusillum]|uniref:RING-type domain-containing protein n=1 Tax=Endocarpon pusillum TaxID=364733 RepID=A0A8H7ALD8_9EURO|nr:hypothetical protein GJ744_006795 [Endocarpon pusillum]
MPTFHSHSSGTLLEEPSRRKRSYHDFLHSESRTASPSASPPRLRFSITPSPSNLSSMSRPSPMPPRRFIGDGFDYRRPVMSTSGNHQAAQTSTPTPDVIDLTDDSDSLHTQPILRGVSAERSVPRLQRLTRRRPDQSGQGRQDAGPVAAIPALRVPIIDLETLEFGDAAGAPPSPPPAPNGPPMVSDNEFLALFQEPPSSPGFEILGERSVRPEQPPPPPPRRSVAERRPTPYVTEEEREASEVPPLPPAPAFRGLPYGLASWIVHAGTRLAGGNTAGRTERNVPQEGLSNRYTYSNGVYTQVPQYNSGSSWQPQPQLQLPRISALDAFQRPRLNYEAQGFELIGAAHTSPPPRPSSPYKAPRTSAPGFTRKVEEDDIAVCPHCGDELGTGNGDLKQQIWIVKQCGHVYCGECAMNRHVGKSKKAALQALGKPEPFKLCVVQDCNKPVTSKTALFQVYL